MPNWCDTTYKCIGEEKELKEFLQILNNNNNRKTPRVQNGFGTMWLGCIIDNFGLNWKEYQCRGEVVDFDYANDILTIYQSTAWCEQEGFRQAITERFPSIEVYYAEEECGCGVYCTNSFEMFPTKYLVEYFANNEEGQGYFEDLKGVKEFIEGITGKKVDEDLKAITELADTFIEDSENEDWYIYINEFTLV